MTNSDEIVDYPIPPVDAIRPPADLRPVEGLAVGGLREVPVKW